MRWIVIALVSLTACGGGEPAASGGLSAASLEAAKADVHAFQPWVQAEPKLIEKLGAATKVDGDTHIWAAKAGEACKLLKVQNMSGNVGNVELADGACP